MRREETEGDRKQKSRDILEGVTNTTDIERKLQQMKKDMLKAASDLEFEQAATLRDQIKKLEKLLLDLPA